MELTIDTASALASVAITEAGHLVAELSWSAGRGHAADLLPNIERVLQSGGASRTAIDAIFVNRGPGGYAGLRVGISTALALALTTLLKNENQAAGITLFLALTLAPLGGAWWPLDIVPNWMRGIGHLSPVAWVMDGFRSLIFFDGNLGAVIVPILVLLAMTAGFFAFGVARFKFD